MQFPISSVPLSKILPIEISGAQQDTHGSPNPFSLSLSSHIIMIR